MRTITLVHHRVADFDAWKQVYDSFVDQPDAGVPLGVWRDRDDPNAVVVVHAFDSFEQAQALFSSEELKGAMEQAGVDTSSLRIEFLDEV